jgi:hypothetical protein
MTRLEGNRLNGRLTRLENQVTPSRPYEAQRWIWIDGRLHSQHTDEAFGSVEEWAQAYAGRHVLFVDHVIVSARDGTPCGYSDERLVDQPREEARR